MQAGSHLFVCPQRKSFFNARPAGGKKTKKDMQQNTPRSMQDARAATNMTAQNMRKSSSGAKAYQEGETALQTFLKRKIFSNKDSSSPPAYASPPHRTATAVMPAPRTATAVSSSPLSSSRYQLSKVSAPVHFLYYSHCTLTFDNYSTQKMVCLQAYWGRCLDTAARGWQ
jgi:hypothetical protein